MINPRSGIIRMRLLSHRRVQPLTGLSSGAPLQEQVTTAYRRALGASTLKRLSECIQPYRAGRLGLIPLGAGPFLGLNRGPMIAAGCKFLTLGTVQVLNDAEMRKLGKSLRSMDW